MNAEPFEGDSETPRERHFAASGRNLMFAVIGGGLLLVVLIEMLSVVTLGKKGGPASTSSEARK